jgi:membrane-bound lytic murein transglycosylase B
MRQLLVRRLSGALLLGLSLAAGVAVMALPVQAQEASQAGFQRFVQGLWPEAKARGVSQATFNEAFRGVEPDAKIIALTKKQSEFVRPIWDYINGSISAERLKRGRDMAAEWSKTLSLVEKTYGVPRSVVLGVWGMETNYGSFTGSIYAIRALSTLAYTIAPTSSGRNCSPPSRSWNRSMWTAPRCWAPGPAPWARPSSCLRAS